MDFLISRPVWSRKLCGDAGAGLEHVHYFMVVHCDVKPANILLTPPDPRGMRQAVLGDFDLSLDQAHRQQLSVSASQAGGRGTPGALSMAPEVELGQVPTDRSDVFGLGGVLVRAISPVRADQWSRKPAHERWDRNGKPLLGRHDECAVFVHGIVVESVTRRSWEAADRLLAAMLHKMPERRPSCAEVVRDEFFTAMGLYEERAVAEALQENAILLEQRDLSLAAREAAVQQEKRFLDVEAGQRRKEMEEARAVLAALNRDLEVQKAALERSLRLPPEWSSAGEGPGYRLIPDPDAKDWVQGWIRQTAEHVGGCNGACSVARARVSEVYRVENPMLWRMYLTKRDEVASHPLPNIRLRAHVQQPSPRHGGAPLVDEVNELRLWHGTSDEVARRIVQHGFDERNAHMEGLYGSGCYFADRSCKSHQYAASKCAGKKHYVLLAARVTMGWAMQPTGDLKYQRRPIDNPAIPNRPLDSVWAQPGRANGGSQWHPEMVVYNGAQAYPEFLIHYQAP